MKAYVTLLSTQSYLPGVIALQKSLQAVNSTTSLYCLCTPNIDNDLITTLHNLSISPILVNEITPTKKPSRVKGTYTKIALWSLCQFDRVVYLDADILVMRNIEHLFDSESKFLACHDACADVFNSGVMVLKPSTIVYNDMLQKMEELESYDQADQGFLNAYFNNWFSSVDRLSMAYNMPYMTCLACPNFYNHIEKTAKVHIIHFWGPRKPWEEGFFDNGNDITKKIHELFKKFVLH